MEKKKIPLKELLNNEDLLTNPQYLKDNIAQLTKNANQRLYRIEKGGYEIQHYVKPQLNKNNRFSKIDSENPIVQQNKALQLARFLRSNYSSISGLNESKKALEERVGKKLTREKFNDIHNKVGEAWGQLLEETSIGDLESNMIHQFFQEASAQGVENMVELGINMVREGNKALKEYRDKLNLKHKANRHHDI